jgi:hypothetical protein
MGRALEEALQWASDKSLSDLHYRLLSASQEWDAAMVRMELEAQAKANQMLAAAQRKARQMIWVANETGGGEAAHQIRAHRGSKSHE